MKNCIKTLISIVFFCTLQKNITAQCSWNNVGAAAASSATNTSYNDIAISSGDIPYISYCDAGASNALTVKTYSGSAWQTVGSLSTFVNSSFTSIALDGTTPIVAFADGTNGSKATVKTYSAGVWSNIGLAVSTGSASYVSLALFGSTPYVAYIDATAGYKATVKTYSAGAWVALGTAVSTSSAAYTGLSIDNTGTPYLIYQDIANGNNATVKKYSAGSWVAVGTGTVSGGSVLGAKLDVSYNNIPYVAYYNSSWICTVKTFSASSWQTVGTGTISNVYSSMNLGVDPLGTPYISYYDLLPYKTSVSKYDGSAWNYAGNSGFSNVTPNSTALAFDSKGYPYITYDDGINGAFVKKLGSTTTVLNPAPQTLCSGSSGLLSAIVTNTVSGMSYQWQVNTGGGFTNVLNGSNYSGATTASLSLINVPPSFNGYQYRCVVNDLCSNIISGAALLTVNPTPTLSVNTATICQGTSATLSANGATTYSWNTGATTSAINVSPATNTTYTVTGTNSGCVSTLTTQVIVNPNPTITTSNATICQGYTATITASGATTYSWSTGSTTSVINVSPASNTIYTVTGINSLGCKNTVTTQVIVNANPTITVNSATICQGTSGNMTASGASNYTWNPGAMSGANVIVNPTATTIYTVIGSIGTCTGSTTGTVVVNPLPNVTISTSSSSLCITDTVNLFGSGANSYTWSTSQTTSSIAVTPTITTTYTINGTDVSGCVNTASISLSVIGSKILSGTVTSTAGAVSGNMILYKYSSILSKWDSVTFTPFSSIYNFGTIDKGQYVIKAVPTATNMQITYGSNAPSWKGASIINHGCLSNSTQSISIMALTTLTTTGTGFLSGRIIEDTGYVHKPTTPGNPIGGIVVKGGRNPGGQMFTQTVTDANGNYSIGNLPDGTDYFILVDIPGLDTNLTYHRDLTPGNNQLTGLDFTVDSMYINPINNSVGINDINLITHQLVIYPNPTSEYININYELKNTSIVYIELFDILGRPAKVLLDKTSQISDKYKQQFSVADLKTGVYFIRLKINQNESNVKLIITD